MNREQKQAWICVVCMLLAIAVALIILVIHFLAGAPKILYAIVIPCVGGPLGGLICLFVPKDKGKVKLDERDVMIRKNAATAGFAGAFLFTGAVCMIPFFVLGADALIRARWLPQIWIGTFVTQFFFYMLAIIAGYGRGDKENE